jgi:hypothetical protein
LCSKNSRWHLESGVDALMVVVMDLLVDCVKELTHTIKTVHVAKQLIFEASVKGYDKVPE